MRSLTLAVFVLGLAFLAPGGPVPQPEPAAAAGMNDRFGIDHISYGNGRFSNDRYRQAQEAGVGWNRWVFYWHDMEEQPGGFDFSKQDATVKADKAQGFKILGLLFGTPKWAVDEAYLPQPSPSPSPSASPSPARAAEFQDTPERFPRVGQKHWPIATPQTGEGACPTCEGIGAGEGACSTCERLQADGPVNSVLPPKGLYLPVFADGTDSPAPGKAINQNNLWARFVQRTVNQYKGLVSAWEVWNEPDFTPTANTGWFGFWAGGVDNYARILKVAYLTIKATDPNAPVVMGGMAFWLQEDFFPRLLASITRDPIARQYGFYFDATAWHWYSRASQLYERTLWVKDEMKRAGIGAKPIWITETNLPVCGDTGVPVAVQCTSGTHRGTVEHQAAYMFQSVAYGFVAGVEKIFFFQLFDDDLGPGEYYGLVRNNGSARPALTAIKTVTNYFNLNAQGYRTLSNAGRVELMTFPGPTGQRLRMVWSTSPSGMSADLPMDAANFSLIDQTGNTQNGTVNPGTLYKIGLAGANLNDNPSGPPDYLVGGKPYLFLERGVPGGNGNVEGSVRDSRGNMVTGVKVLVGDTVRLDTDAAGRYRAEVPPGLYDVNLSTIVPLTETAYSVPVWAGRVSTQTHLLRQLFQNFIPIDAFRARPVR